MNRFDMRLLPLVALVLILPACDRSGRNGADSGEEEAGDQPTNRVDIPATVRSNLGITFAKVERRDVANTIRVPGSFELQPLAKHEYRLMLAGRVQFEVDQLDVVKAGTLLYRFRSPQWPALQGQIDVAVAALEQSRAKSRAVEARVLALARADLKRADLEAQAAELRAEVEKRVAELRAALNNATRVLDLHRAAGAAGPTPDDLLVPVDVKGRPVPRYQTIDWIEVHATEPGVVESLAVTDGAFVEETTLVLSTVDPSKLRFRAVGMQGDLPRFHTARKVRIVPPQAKGGFINEGIEAGLQVGLAADPRQRTVTLFANPVELRPWARPGVSGFLEIAVEATDGVVLAIPRSAVVKDGITHVFFKRDPNNGNQAIRIEADLGVDDGRWVEVKSGVGPNDEVVMNGAYELKLATAMSGTVQKGGHFHADGTFHKED